MIPMICRKNLQNYLSLYHQGGLELKGYMFDEYNIDNN